MSSNHSLNADQCLENCQRCYETCLRIAMNHCLVMGGKHVEPSHFSLMIACAKVCETSVALQLSGSPFSAQICQVCADICTACADSCEAIGDMDECVISCRTCAESCRHMASEYH